MLSRLYSANRGLLQQKLGLMEALVTRFGVAKAKDIYQTACPIVGASMGQHIRHSMDHIERAIYAISHFKEQQQQQQEEHVKIRYDVRERGGADEHDLMAAQERIQRVSQMLENITHSQSYIPVLDHRVDAVFMLSGDDDTEMPLPSTAARELGFACHHGIHHMAMVKIIALQTAQLPASDLPLSFGKAPSTQNFERTQKKGQEEEATVVDSS